MAKRNIDTDEWKINIPDQMTRDRAEQWVEIGEIDCYITQHFDRNYKQYTVLVTNPTGAAHLFAAGFRPVLSKTPKTSWYKVRQRKFKSKRVVKQKEEIKKRKNLLCPYKKEDQIVMSPKKPKPLKYRIPFLSGLNIHHILKTHNIINYEIKDSLFTDGILLCVDGDGWNKLSASGYAKIEHIPTEVLPMTSTGRRIDTSKIL